MESQWDKWLHYVSCKSNNGHLFSIVTNFPCGVCHPLRQKLKWSVLDNCRDTACRWRYPRLGNGHFCIGSVAGAGSLAKQSKAYFLKELHVVRLRWALIEASLGSAIICLVAPLYWSAHVGSMHVYCTCCHALVSQNISFGCCCW